MQGKWCLGRSSTHIYSITENPLRTRISHDCADMKCLQAKVDLERRLDIQITPASEFLFATMLCEICQLVESTVAG